MPQEYPTKWNLKSVFSDHKIRRVFHNTEWWFSIIDVVETLTDSANPRRYWSDLKRQLVENEGFSELYEKIVQLKLKAPDGKMRETDCANTEGLFRTSVIFLLIFSIMPFLDIGTPSLFH